LIVTMRNKVVLPWPPSANKMYRVVNGRPIKSKFYREWTEEAILLIKGALDTCPEDEVFHVSILVNRPDRRKRDIDNFIKPTIDALVKSNRTPDDSQMGSVLAAWGCFEKNARYMTVEVTVGDKKR
jgi:crossover junction endodeoxyribonuclease RusA